MTDLFSRDTGSPAPMQALKPANWRAPTDPREHVCGGCAGAACIPESFFALARTQRRSAT